MTTGRKILVALSLLLLAGIGLAAYLATPDKARLPVNAVAGTDPQLTGIRAESFPTVGVADPVGWPANAVTR